MISAIRENNALQYPMIELINKKLKLPVGKGEFNQKDIVGQGQSGFAIHVDQSVCMGCTLGGIDAQNHFVRVRVFSACGGRGELINLVTKLMRLFHDRNIEISEYVLIDLRLESVALKTSVSSSTGYAELCFAALLVEDMD